MTVTVHNDEAGSSYRVDVDGRPAGSLVYQVHGTRVALLHTVVNAALQGRGVAGELVRQALDDLRSQGRTITVQCPYVVAFLRRNPEYEDLVDAEEPGTFTR